MPARAPTAAALLLLLAGCAGAPPRGYYRPAGAPPSEVIASYVEQGVEALVEARCQGAYANRVARQRIGSVHVQMEVARTRSGDLLLPRDELVVDVEPADGSPRVRLELSAAFSGRDPVEGDLLVPAWTRRPFDLFFDDPELLAGGAPRSVLLGWELRDGQRAQPGQCEFELVPEDEPGGPARLEPADANYGVRNGYYLPGVTLGERRLRTAGEERLHHLFHEPEGWLW